MNRACKMVTVTDLFPGRVGAQVALGAHPFVIAVPDMSAVANRVARKDAGFGALGKSENRTQESAGKNLKFPGARG